MTDAKEIDPAVHAEVDRILRARLTYYGFDRADVRPARDHDGDPVLLIDVAYHHIQRPIDRDATFGIVTDIREALASLGETRFPLVRHHFDEAQQIAS